jgi:hypothetical protein
MDPSAKKQQESLNNKDNNAESDKEMKAKRKYYGKVFVALIFSLMIFEYYMYMYQITWVKLTSKIKLYFY